MYINIITLGYTNKLMHKTARQIGSC